MELLNKIDEVILQNTANLEGAVAELERLEVEKNKILNNIHNIEKELSTNFSIDEKAKLVIERANLSDTEKEINTTKEVISNIKSLKVETSIGEVMEQFTEAINKEFNFNKLLTDIESARKNYINAMTKLIDATENADKKIDTIKPKISTNVSGLKEYEHRFYNTGDELNELIKESKLCHHDIEVSIERVKTLQNSW